MGSVVCPKPRRVGILAIANNFIRPVRSHLSQSEAADVCDSKAGEDLLDIIRRKEESVSFVTSSTPFYLGSPPSRTSNPLAQDSHFGDEKHCLVSPSLSPILRPASLVQGGGCARMKLGLKPAPVRVEGFDCLNNNRQNSSRTLIHKVYIKFVSKYLNVLEEEGTKDQRPVSINS